MTESFTFCRKTNKKVCFKLIASVAAYLNLNYRFFFKNKNKNSHCRLQPSALCCYSRVSLVFKQLEGLVDFLSNSLHPGLSLAPGRTKMA